MRSLTPDPANPWPHDMVLHIDRASSAMLAALAVAEAWRIDLGIPALRPAPVGVVVGDRPLDATPVALTAWRDAVAMTATPDRTVSGAAFDADREAALGIDHAALVAWIERWPKRPPTGPLHEQPERRDVGATTLAWQAGLTHILVFPLDDRWAVRQGSTLLVDETTRRDPARYVDVLLAFAGDALPRIS
ncbi:hypothetical protein [Agrococcus jejuensis]|uniref:hypothetical protein n=1 Tax=Agrococcus jejuensis TaxID=399736 RepID=UPI00119E88B2|nr:hypothetical protein [Agrococcus jejuensis]